MIGMLIIIIMTSTRATDTAPLTASSVVSAKRAAHSICISGTYCKTLRRNSKRHKRSRTVPDFFYVYAAIVARNISQTIRREVMRSYIFHPSFLSTV